MSENRSLILPKEFNNILALRDVFMKDPNVQNLKEYLISEAPVKRFGADASLIIVEEIYYEVKEILWLCFGLNCVVVHNTVSDVEKIKLKVCGIEVEFISDLLFLLDLNEKQYANVWFANFLGFDLLIKEEAYMICGKKVSINDLPFFDDMNYLIEIAETIENVDAYKEPHGFRVMIEFGSAKVLDDNGHLVTEYVNNVNDSKTYSTAKCLHQFLMLARHKYERGYDN